MRAILRTLSSGLVVVAIVMAGLEVGLRLAPGLIPEALLRHFFGPLRAQVAERTFLPHVSQSVLVERVDGGPPLRVLRPFTEVAFEYRDTGERGTTVMDGLGFPNAPENDWRLPRVDIVTVGDSFTVPAPPHLELSWSSQLGRLLGRSLYVVSRGSLGPYEYVELLRTAGLAKQPEIVVMQIYGGNDLRDAARYQDWVKASPEEREHLVEERSRSADVHDWLDNALGRYSYAYNTLVVALALGAGELRAVLDPSLRVDFRYRAEFDDGPVPLNVENGDLDEVRYARRLRAGEIELSAYDGALARYAELAREHGFLPVVSYAPSAYSAYAEFVVFEDPELSELMPWFCERQCEHLRRVAEGLGLLFVDLTPAMRAAARELGGKELLYHPISVHYASAGEGVAASAVADALSAFAQGGAEAH